MKEKYLKCLIVIVVIIIGGLFIYQNINKENKPLPEVKLKEIVNKNKSFAIMIQEKSEIDKYQEYNSNKWPGDDYKFKEAKCIDNNGNEITEAVTYENDKITLTTNKTVYCTIYFDKSIIGKLREDEELANKDNLSKDLQGGMYRYQGTDDVHNWICFGTIDNCGTNDDNIDKYMYRIIGITPEGQLYLIKETVLKEGIKAEFKWNSKTFMPDCKGEACEWPNVDLYKRLNGEESNGNPIFVNNPEYAYMALENDWYKLIAEHNWMYGDTSDRTMMDKYNGQLLYAIETGNEETFRYWPDEVQETCSSNSPCAEKEYTWSKNIPAKISLMYIHDYLYSYYDGSTDESRGNPGSYTNIKNNNSWIHFQKDGYNSSTSFEWLLSRRCFGNGTENYISVWIISDEGGHSFSGLDHERGTRPVFYLKSDLKISKGGGTKTNPYIIEILNKQD